MSSRRDHELRAAIERALRGIAANAISLDQAIAEVSAAADARHVESTPAERTAQEGERLLRYYYELGAGPDAARKTALHFARDRNDPQAVERIAQRVRALARREKTQPLRVAG